MPFVVTRDWLNGPIGGGFLLYFQSHRDVFYDGGPIVFEDGKPETKRKKRLMELIAVFLLMRNQG